MSTGQILEKVKSAFKKVTKSAGNEGGNGGEQVSITRSKAAALEGLSRRPLATPAVDIFENRSELLIRADVPGATAENTIVTYNESDGTLVLYVKPGEASASGEAWVTEFEEADWYRSFQLPYYVDGGKAASNVKDGLLTVRVPKRPEPEPKIIPVRAG